MISETSTWPQEVFDFLQNNLLQFKGWECYCCSNSRAHEYDLLIEQSKKIFKKYSLIGYHCTKLTREEIESIDKNGMFGQNGESLNKRIDQLLQSNIITKDISTLLKLNNQSNECNRAHMLWFCFFEPHLAGEHGIGRFFNSWGGEALYNYHEDNPITGEVLRKIGIPCIIKADVPISSMDEYKYPIGAMARVLLQKNGHRIRNDTEHDGYSTQRISSERIIEIIEHPSEEFDALTKRNEWEMYVI